MGQIRIINAKLVNENQISSQQLLIRARARIKQPRPCDNQRITDHTQT